MARPITIQYTIAILCCAVLVVVQTQRPSYDYSYNPHPEHYTRKVVLKQGTLHGIVVQRRFDDRVVSVEQYLGIPYAKPPVGDLRFMPPGSAPSWTGIKYADSFRDVCPQNLPDTTNMEHDRRQHLTRLFRHLRNESEDCLYLNIYTPSQGDDRSPRKYPVMVFVHGESFEWNSGNAYDGSLLAAYGKVIVVTLNFRLGILGFLKIGPTRANFGLIDQIAALVWIKDNIEAFGGNPDAVTMFGHGTGAACISHLMLSPMIMSDGNRLLFQRAILMSGTALADWAMAGKPMEVTYNVARILNCPPSDDEQTLTRCLTKRRLQEIKEAAVSSSQFITRFGPVVDGSVIPNDPKKIMTNYHDIFSRFELMYGVTELESVHLLEAVALTHGMLERERDSQLRRYLDTRCEYKPDFCLMRTLEVYGGTRNFDRERQDVGLPFHERDRASLARDTLLEMLSDARTTAPITLMAKLHSIRNAQSYFYVFAHKTASRNLDIDKSVYGEDLPFVFGWPLDTNPNKFNPDQHFTKEEKLLSKMMMTLWSNFVYSGNPNIPGNPTAIGDDHMIWYNFDIEWPEYDKHQQRYLHLDHPPALSARYREHRVSYWNDDFPKLRDIPLLTITTKHPYRPDLNPRGTSPSPIIADVYGNPIYGRPTRPTKYQDMYGHEEKRGPYGVRPSVTFGQVVPTPTPVKSGTSTNLIIVLGVLFLLVNVALFSGLYYKCVTLKKKNAGNKTSIEDQTTVENPLEKSVEPPTENGCNLMKMIGTKSSKSGDTYEAVKTHQSTSSKRKLTRQFSSSTIDAHTKVRDWIAQEIVNKYSPKFLRRNRRQISVDSKQRKHKAEELKDVATVDNSGITASTSTLGQSPTRPVTPAEEIKDSPKLSMIPVHKKKAEKVSVAVDATPAGRGSSVMRQQPIELTKSLDYGSFDSERDTRLRRSATLDDVCSIRPQEQLSRRNSTSINLQLQQPEEATVIKIEHHHSRSDPVDTRDTGRKLRTFDPGVSVNQTSRDEVDVAPLTPEESLQIIKRRNFPKVLPDLPGDSKQSLAQKRRSMPAPGYLFLPIPENPSFSQPNSPTGRITKCPPPPPPRISTLGRNQTFQPAPKLAMEPPVPEEPEIACNNLYIGPLIPCRENRKIILKPADDYKFDNQPIYDNLNPRPMPKTIITADNAPPIRKIEPKVIIKPTISRTISDPSRNKGPRVVVNDNLATPSSPKDKTDVMKPDFISGIPVLSRENLTKDLNEDKMSEQKSSSDSSPSEGSDTGTVVKKV